MPKVGGGEARRAQVKRAALEILAERGFADLPVKDIARRAGVSTGVLYHYFSSKDEILLEALGIAFREADEVLRGRVAARPPGHRLPTYLQAAATMACEHPEAARALLAAVGQAQASDEVRARLAALFASFRAYAQDLLQQEVGGARDGAAALIVAAGIGLACQWAADPDAVNLPASGDVLQSLLAASAAAADPSPAGRPEEVK